MHPYEYLTLVVLHILGAATWIGSLISTLFGSIPHARASGDLTALKHAGKIVVGRLGLAALILQVLTGVRLGTKFGWGVILRFEGPASHLVLSKITLLVVIILIGGHLYHKTLPRLSPEGLRSFAAATWLLLVLSLLIAVAGAGLQTGALL
ncbi:MAG: hypothetical protein DYG94_00005 [Leptolyngbya sp. PLA3]|nr:MAG: hypothetical protein EDM82_01870 [Cyanobacteria bacterium CYA]MCE7967119.1 hypothetical protein [Leptolyngbya sp. PL-A3]